MKETKDIQYFVRKSWDNELSQVGIDYNFLINAKKACDKLEGYKVFDSTGKQVYPDNESNVEIQDFNNTINEEFDENNSNDEILIPGKIISIIPDAIFINGNKVPEKLFSEKLFLRNIENDICTISRKDKGPILGTISKNYIKIYDGNEIPQIQPFIVQIISDNCNLYFKASKQSKILCNLNKYSLFTIINEKNGFGKIKKGSGWIDMNDVKVIK